MNRMNLLSLLAALPASSILPGPSTAVISAKKPVEITLITADSRQVRPGALFVAYRGVSLDGHRFIPDAVARGAAAIVVEAGSQAGAVPSPGQAPIFVEVPDGREALASLSAAWYGFPARRLVMVGITGTDGKTTTTNFLYHMLHTAAWQPVSMISTVNAVIGDEVADTGLHTTTPDAPEVQRYLAQMVAAGTKICLLEVTSHGLVQHRVSACDFDVAILTNMTHEHLDLHGSVEAYWAAKARLFESLATAAPKGFPKTAILNCDDASFAYIRPRLAAATAWVGYSLSGHPQARLVARDITCRPDKTRFTIQGPGYTFDAETLLLGDYNVANCLAAATAAMELFKLPVEVVRAGIAALPGVPGRMERIDEGQSFTAVVDFAHTPNALRRSLLTARELAAGRVVAVFGCAGRRDVAKRTLMGQLAAELADFTVITAEDPRTENLEEIMAETARAMAAAGAVEGRAFEREPDRGRAIYRAVQLAQPGDMVLVLGKGHEQSMCFGQVEYPWDDRQAVRSALKGQALLTLPTAHPPKENKRGGQEG